MSDLRQREAQFDVSAEFAFPDLHPLAPADGAIEAVSAVATRVYLDTASRDLFSAGASLMRQDQLTHTAWALSVGDDADEIRAETATRTLPPQLRDLVVGVRSGESLRTALTVRTNRTTHLVIGADGTVRCELHDDLVNAVVFGARRSTLTWRVVTVVAGDDTAHKQATKLLVKAGASESTGLSQVQRAFAASSSRPATQTLASLIRTYVTAQVDALLQRDIDLRRDQDVVHPTRVAIRRLRSVLRSLSDVFDPERATALNEELSWYAGLLGEVRDREVLRIHLRDAVAALPPELVIGPVAERIDGMLSSERDAAKLTLARAMKNQRYFALVRELKLWRDEPAFFEGREPGGGVGSRVRAVSAKAEQRVHSAEKTEDDESVHRARKAAKRARYIAELARPRLGSRAKTVIDKATALQDRLGSHQDSVIAMEYLLKAQAVADAAPGESPFTYGLLWAYEQQKAAAASQR